jgi:hypothetical protein
MVLALLSGLAWAKKPPKPDPDPDPDPPSATYEVTWLGTLTGDSSEASCVNSQGVVVGSYRTIAVPGSDRAFVGAAATGITDLTQLTGQNAWTLIFAEDVNEAGQIVGRARSTDPTITIPHGFLYDPTLDSPLTILPILPDLPAGYFSFTASQVNSTGDVIGGSYFQWDEDGNAIGPNAVVYIKDETGAFTITDLGIAGLVEGMNDAGEFVGEIYREDYAYRYTLLTDQVEYFYDITGLHDINEAGQMTGWVDDGRRCTPIRYSDASGIEPLDRAASFARGISINASGDVLGQTTRCRDHGRCGFLYRDDAAKTVILDELIDGPIENLPKWIDAPNIYVLSMSDRDPDTGLGYICGVVELEPDQPREAFVLKPVLPAP